MPADKEIGQDWLKMLQAADLSRALAEQEQAHRDQVRRMLLDFLDILDSLNRLLAQDDTAREGTLMVLRRQLLGAFERTGVCFFEGTGRPFDPERQEAVATRKDAAVKPGVVVEELRCGCEWQGELLRIAQVVVSK